MKNIFLLILCILICQLAGIIGSIFTFEAIPTWYAVLNKPSLNPPNWVFGPVWTVLYTLMGISLFIVWKKREQGFNIVSALYIFFTQLILNAAWSIVFFGVKSISGALILIIILWFTILLTIIKFSNISKPSSYLLIPYILWVSFAAYLNYSIYSLNK